MCSLCSRIEDSGEWVLKTGRARLCSFMTFIVLGNCWSVEDEVVVGAGMSLLRSAFNFL